jgi:hypothetical protein
MYNPSTEGYVKGWKGLSDFAKNIIPENEI